MSSASQEKIAGRTLEEWREFARRDDCLSQMVPSDLRQLLGHMEAMRFGEGPVTPSSRATAMRWLEARRAYCETNRHKISGAGEEEEILATILKIVANENG